MRTTKMTKSNFLRSFYWGWRQQKRTQVCPNEPRLDGQVVAITGGNSGIGLETVKGLLNRGAEVIILCRNQIKTERAMQSIDNSELLHYVPMDLGDLNSISPAVAAINKILDTRLLDQLILNAGIGGNYPHSLSPQGYETTFAVNVLGHHVLFEMLREANLLTHRAHIIAVAGDIYFQATDCTPQYDYDGERSMQVYARTKVGVMWWGLECHLKYPNYQVNLVHPGVIPMGLGSNQHSLMIKIMDKVLLSTEKGAQTTLYCATQKDVENGAYYHNALGKVILPKGDIALDQKRAADFWEVLQGIYHTKNGQNQFENKH